MIQALRWQAAVLWATLQSVSRLGLPRRRDIAHQIQVMGIRTLVVVGAGLGFFGAAMVAHADPEARPLVQDIAVVGPPYFHLLVREFGPVLTGALAALKIGSMVAAELATMVQTEQTEALVMCAGDPYAELVAPRLIAGLLALPSLLLFGILVGSATAALTAVFGYGSSGSAWFDPLMTFNPDLWSALVKAVLFGLAIPLAGASAGLNSAPGATGIGQATTQGAVWAFMMVLTLDVIVVFATAALGA
jgi:phospholipid/cholesterol/gamma-HCH transport system permease protein